MFSMIQDLTVISKTNLRRAHGRPLLVRCGIWSVLIRFLTDSDSSLLCVALEGHQGNHLGLFRGRITKISKLVSISFNHLNHDKPHPSVNPSKLWQFFLLPRLQETTVPFHPQAPAHHPTTAGQTPDIIISLSKYNLTETFLD